MNTQTTLVFKQDIFMITVEIRFLNENIYLSLRTAIVSKAQSRIIGRA